MLDLLKLQIFLAVAESLSFSEAARHLNLSQPTLSYHIKHLEQYLDCTLFDRSGSRLKLTEAGRLLVPQARKLFHDLNRTEQLIDSLKSDVIGEIRIACSTSTGKYILPLIAARFHQQHPHVMVSILACTPEHVVPHLLMKKADLGIVSYDACEGAYEYQPFFDDHLLLIAPQNYPIAIRSEIEPAELLTIPHIIREPSSGTRRVLLAELGKHSIALEDMNIFLELGNAEAVIKVVEAGFGVSFVSKLSAQWALTLGTVVEVPVLGFDLRHHIYMIRPAMRVSHRAAEVFWGFIHDPQNSDLLHLAST